MSALSHRASLLRVHHSCDASHVLRPQQHDEGPPPPGGRKGRRCRAQDRTEHLAGNDRNTPTRPHAHARASPEAGDPSAGRASYRLFRRLQSCNLSTRPSRPAHTTRTTFLARLRRPPPPPPRLSAAEGLACPSRRTSRPGPDAPSPGAAGLAGQRVRRQTQTEAACSTRLAASFRDARARPASGPRRRRRDSRPRAPARRVEFTRVV